LQHTTSPLLWLSHLWHRRYWITMRDRATDTPCLPCLHPDAALEITRNNVLAHDLSDVVFKPGTRDCLVLSGVMTDPYSGDRVEFERSRAKSVQIDHVLSAALSRSLPLSAGHYVDVMPLMAVVAVRWARA
ncbi:hypothetical protein ACFFQ6_10880, partial [Rhodococcus baikonurensis]